MEWFVLGVPALVLVIVVAAWVVFLELCRRRLEPRSTQGGRLPDEYFALDEFNDEELPRAHRTPEGGTRAAVIAARKRLGDVRPCWHVVAAEDDRSVDTRVSRTETGAETALRVLLVEDDSSIAEPLVEGLEHEGFAVKWVASGADALAAEVTDVVLLDLGLPDLDGRKVCRRLRDRSRVPIIVVTARDDEIDRVLLLEMAADDYVVKPFGFHELVARIRAVHRRESVAVDTPEPGNDDAGPLRIDRRAQGACGSTATRSS